MPIYTRSVLVQANLARARSIVAFGVAFLICSAAVSCPAWALPPSYYEGGPGWDDTNVDTAFEPTNRRGAAPVVAGPPAIFSQTSLSVRRDSLQSADELGSTNFQLAVPIVGLPGRGLDLALDLIYNSHVWHEGDGIAYDIDADWPGPGWSLGFGKLVVNYLEEIRARCCQRPAQSHALLLEPDGTRHPFVNTSVSALRDRRHVRFLHQTTDGSLIQYFTEIKDDRLIRGEAKYPNGMLIEFDSARKGRELYPTRIVDANGNYIKINYLNNVGPPQIVSIIDTLGRHIDFHYDARSRLTAITGPALGGGTRTLVRLHYMDLPLRYAFAAGVKAFSRGEVTVIDAIYFPGTGTGYWFGDPDSYSSYGILAKVSQRRAMSFYAGPEETEQGTISPGVVTREQIYNYPLDPDPTLTHAPTYTTMTETWEGMDTAPAVMQYSAPLNAFANARSVAVAASLLSAT